ncbi:replication protein A 70 kDa DNA-binding subunit B [Tanacetum coccineum]
MESCLCLITNLKSHFSDVIGTVVAIGDVVVVPNSLVKKERRSVVIENTGGTRVNSAFWDNWTHMFDQYASNNDCIGPLTFVLQVAKVKYLLDEPAVHNSLFGTRIFINKDIPEIIEFKIYTSKDGYEKNDHKIELFSPEKVKITPEMFFKDAIESMVVGIRDVEPMAKPMNGFGSASIGSKSKSASSGSRPKKSWRCDEHGVIYQVVPRFTVILRVIDETGSASLVMFDTIISKMCNGISAFEVMNKHGQNTSDDLNVIVGKKYLFKVLFTQHNVDSNSHIYSCKALSDEDELIIHFKNGFIETQTDDEFRTPESNALQVASSSASALDVTKFSLDTPLNKDDASSSGKVSRKRDMIDLDDYPDVTEDSGSNNKPSIVDVKVEKEE